MTQIISWHLAARAAVFGASLVLAAAISLGTVHMPGAGALENATAYISTLVLGAFGVSVTQDGTIIDAGGFVAIVVAECTAIDILLVFSAAVLVWPASHRAKAAGILLLAPVIVALNLVRVISLLLTGIEFPEHFEAAHYRVWQPAMILAAIAMWLLWQRWASRRTPRRLTCPAAVAHSS